MPPQGNTAIITPSGYGTSSKAPGQLMISGPNGRKKIIEVCKTEVELPNVPVGKLKAVVVKDLKLAGDIRLVYGTETLDESSTLGQYQIRRLSTIQSVFHVPGGCTSSVCGTKDYTMELKTNWT